MNIANWLIKTILELGQAGVDSPRRDALVLLEDTMQKDRAWVISHPEYVIPAAKLQKVNKLIRRRISREPLAYIRSKAWFYGRFFIVSPDVMIPRPESESFIEIVKQIEPSTVIDLGTGSGCLAISASLELPATEIIAIDNSSKALAAAKKNARLHGTKINFLNGNLLDPVVKLDPRPGTTVLMANLPYVPDALVTSPEITYEPAEALFSGLDGLNHYRELFAQCAENPRFAETINIDYILAESLKSQHAAMIMLAEGSGYRLVKTDLLVQLFKKV